MVSGVGAGHAANCLPFKTPAGPQHGLPFPCVMTCSEQACAALEFTLLSSNQEQPMLHAPYMFEEERGWRQSKLRVSNGSLGVLQCQTLFCRREVSSSLCCSWIHKSLKTHPTKISPALFMFPTCLSQE